MQTRPGAHFLGLRYEAGKKTGEPAFHESEPWTDSQNEEQKICPMQQRPEADSRFAEENRETGCSASDHKNGHGAFRQKRQRDTQPGSGEPEAGKFLVLIN